MVNSASVLHRNCGDHVAVSRLGLVVRCSAGKRKDAGSTPLLGSPFSSKNVIYGQSRDFALHN